MKNLTTLELVETLSKLQIEKDYSIVAEPLIKMVDSEKVNILDRFISEINAERDSLIKKFKDFYFKKSNYQEFDEKGLSPARKERHFFPDVGARQDFTCRNRSSGYRRGRWYVSGSTGNSQGFRCTCGRCEFWKDGISDRMWPRFYRVSF